MRAEPDILLIGGEPHDTGSTAGRLAAGYEPHSVDARHPRAPLLIPREERAPFLGD